MKKLNDEYCPEVERIKKNQVNNEYYPKDATFTEIEIFFWGTRKKPIDLMCYLKLLNWEKKLGLRYPEYIVESRFHSFGDFCQYHMRTILDTIEKKNNVKAICSELIKHGIKTDSIPSITLINYGEKTTVNNLKDYLQSKGMKLEDLNIDCKDLEKLGEER